MVGRKNDDLPIVWKCSPYSQQFPGLFNDLRTLQPVPEYQLQPYVCNA
nr:hypothetical protein [Klebsiella michiganensis]